MKNSEVHIKPEQVNKILVIKLRGIGDVIMSTILIDNLRAEFQNSKIDYLTEAPSAGFLENLDEIDTVHVFNRKSLGARLSLFWKIRSEKYDLVIDAFSNPATAQITKFSGAKWRIGFPYKGRVYAYNLFGVSERNKYHMADLHLTLLSENKLLSTEHSLKFGLTEEAQLFSKQYFSENNLDNHLVCAIIPGGGWSSKRCPPEKFAEIADSIIEKYNSKIFLLWGPGDLEEAEQISELMKNESLLAPRTSLLEMGALIRLSSFVIANDSGPMHMSVALGRPTISLHGPTDPSLQGAYYKNNAALNLPELDCIICNKLKCPKNKECFRQLPIDRIIEKVDNLLLKNGIINEAD